MFKDDYKSQMDKITPDAQTKEKILEKINEAAQPPKKRNPAFIWRVSTAAVLCIAVVLAVVLSPKFKNSLNVSGGSEVALDDYTKTAANYGEIYDKISVLYKDYDLYYGSGGSVDYLVPEGSGMVEEGGIDEAAPEPDADDVTNTDDATDTKNETDYSTTNRQVEDVDEADIIKTNGKYIYYLSTKDNKVLLKIIKADGSGTKVLDDYLISSYTTDSYFHSFSEMYLVDDKLAVIGQTTKGNDFYTKLAIYDVKDPKNIKLVNTFRQSGSYSSSRLVGSHVYLLSNYSINGRNAKKIDPETYIPSVTTDDDTTLFDLTDIIIYNDDIKNACYQNVVSYDIKESSITDQKAILDSSENIYCNTKNMILSRGAHKQTDTLWANYSVITRLSLDKGKITYVASNEIWGIIHNQFSIDEYKDTFRFVTTVNIQDYVAVSNGNTTYKKFKASYNYNYLCVLDENLKLLGEIDNIAPDERIYSARFMGDTAYFVTFKQVDPLFCVDLSNPKEPKILSALKIPGFSNYLYPYGENTLLGIGEEDSRVKLSMFDTSNKEDVTENDKFIIEGSSYSSANSNHKATLISYDKNLIGMAMVVDNYSFIDAYSTKVAYKIFSYENGSFVEKASLPIPFSNYSYDDCALTRAVYVGNYLYLVTPTHCAVYTLDGFNQVANFEF